MTAVLMTFEDFKLIKTRKAAQFVFEVPIEDADKALAALGGLPVAADARWVGVAPIDPEHAPVTTPARKGGDLAKQAGILCGTESFQKFLAVDFSDHWHADMTEGYGDRAASVVRSICQVDSRADLDHDKDAADMWKDLVGSYHGYMRATGQADAYRDGPQ